MNKRKAVFLDRDGTIVVHKPYLSSPDQLVLLPNAAKGILLFKELGYLVIIVTNQSGVARGFFDEERLMHIHKKLIDMLKNEGVSIDNIYYCPHWEEGIVEKYKMACDCRKPKPKLILDAAKQYSIDLSRSIMVGDSEVDMLAGKSAGCKCVLIRNTSGNCISAAEVDYVAEDLLEAAGLFGKQESK